MFEAKRNQSEQVVNFTKIDEIIKSQVGTKCDPFVLKLLEKETITTPSKPTPVTIGGSDDKNASMSDMEKMKFKSKYDKYLTRVDKVDMQLKQIYSKYYGQCDEDMKASLKEDDDFKRAHQEKDVIKLCKLLKTINFNYKKSEEPIKTL